MRWDQKSIVSWASEKFGDTTKSRALARANEELAEALRAITSGKPDDDIGIEIADTVIVIWGRAALLGVTITADDLAPQGDIKDIAVDRSMAFRLLMDAHHYLGRAMLYTDALDRSVGIAVWHTVDALADAAAFLGLDLRDLIDAKMVVNDTRVWAQDGSGCAYHVREKEESRAR